MSHCPEELEGAQISHSLALILSAAADPNHNGECILRYGPSLSESPTVLLYVKLFKMLLWKPDLKHNLIEDVSKVSHTI